MEEPKINIIIVEDSKDFRDLLNEHISFQKDIVVTGIAEDGEEALKMIEDKKPDLVILDIIMPNLDGLGVLERLNTMNLDPMPRIIVLSAVSHDKIIQRAMLLGADYYIVKPFALEVLVERIRQLVDNSIYNRDVKKVITYLNENESKINKSQPTDMITEITSIIH
ncbi:response regulator [Clostridium sp. FP2]|uniref:response regulator n=1 Tax=Clostridium TaxID=1485 RepID=UPI001CCC7BD8|nr:MULTISPECIES: response regulator [Clostridium]MBZ9622579.1 response regulator [Clostridium sp. FP2]